MKVSFSLYFVQNPLETRCLPQCPFTLWIYNYARGYCDYRLRVFKLLIDEYIKFMNCEDFDVTERNELFERTYRSIPDAHLLFPNENEENDEALVVQRLYRRIPDVH